MRSLHGSVRAGDKRKGGKPRERQVAQGRSPGLSGADQFQKWTFDRSKEVVRLYRVFFLSPPSQVTVERVRGDLRHNGGGLGPGFT